MILFKIIFFIKIKNRIEKTLFKQIDEYTKTNYSKDDTKYNTNELTNKDSIMKVSFANTYKSSFNTSGNINSLNSLRNSKISSLVGISSNSTLLLIIIAPTTS